MRTHFKARPLRWACLGLFCSLTLLFGFQSSRSRRIQPALYAPAEALDSRAASLKIGDPSSFDSLAQETLNFPPSVCYPAGVFALRSAETVFGREILLSGRFDGDL